MMNPNVQRVVNEYIIPRKDAIIDRKNFLDVYIPEGIPDFLKRRANDVRLMYLLAMDITLMKVIPIFLEDILINLAVASHAQYFEQFSTLQKKFESMDGKDILKDLQVNQILSMEHYEFCKRYYSDDGGLRIRKFEVHNKEHQKFGEKKIVTRSGGTGLVSEAEPFVIDMIKSNPEFLRMINDNDATEQVTEEVLGIFSLLQGNEEMLNRIINLHNKDTFDLYNSLERSVKYQITYKNAFDKSRLEEAVKTNRSIKDYSFDTSDGLRLLLEFKEAVPSFEASVFLLPVLEGGFEIIPVKD